MATDEKAQVQLSVDTIDYAPSWVLDQVIHADQDTGVLAPDECPKNTAPYFDGDNVLGLNAMLVHQFQPPAALAWEGKTSTEILTAIHKAIESYKGKTVPKKTFKAPDDPQFGPAHEVFTSPLIHSPEQAKEKAKDLLSQHVKASGITIAAIDPVAPEGEPVVWKDIGGAMDVTFVPEYEHKVSDHASGLVASGGFIAPPGTDHMHFDLGLTPDKAKKLWENILAAPATPLPDYGDVPEGFYVKEDPDFGEVLVPKPDVPPGWFSKTYIQEDTGAKMVMYPDGVATVDLPGTVYIDGSMHKFDFKGTFDTELAKEIVGLDPVKPGKVLPTVSQWVGGKLFLWHPQYGWMSKEAFDATVANAAEQDLFAEVKPPEPQVSKQLSPDALDYIHPSSHAWCTWHDCHVMDPTHITGKVWQCGSSAHTRPSTPLEDKQMLRKRYLMAESGLLKGASGTG
jgi:hypothetical protein